MINHNYLLSIYGYTVKNLNHVTTLCSASKNIQATVVFQIVQNVEVALSQKRIKMFFFATRDRSAEFLVSDLSLFSVLRRLAAAEGGAELLPLRQT